MQSDHVVRECSGHCAFFPLQLCTVPLDSGDIQDGSELVCEIRIADCRRSSTVSSIVVTRCRKLLRDRHWALGGQACRCGVTPFNVAILVASIPMASARIPCIAPCIATTIVPEVQIPPPPIVPPVVNDSAPITPTGLRDESNGRLRVRRRLLFIWPGSAVGIAVPFGSERRAWHVIAIAHVFSRCRI